MERVDASLIDEVRKLGKGDWNQCFHCGTCTATCALTDEGLIFPRQSYNYLQMGLKDSLASSVEPWLCYYCGNCSEECPRDANPAETMMILRRYLTSVYDWTGLSKKFYTSHWWEFIAVLVIGLSMVLLLGVFNPKGIVTELNGDGGVKINEMFPVHWVHIGDWVMAAAIGGLLISNVLRMWYLVIYKDKTVTVPFTAYFTSFKAIYESVAYFATQKRFNKCDGKEYWAAHWFLMSGYVSLFTMIVLFLPWFQTERIHVWYHPQRLLGYYATFALFYGLFFFLIGRIKKEREIFKHSHLTDWFFVIMLFLTTLSGIMLHVFRINGMPSAVYYSYIFHIAVLVPMLVIEVPFSKWSHLAYRPLAKYFSELKKSAPRQMITHG